MWYLAGMEIVERNHALVVNDFLWTILALIFVSLRYYTRRVVLHQGGMDDYLMLGAMVFTLGHFVAEIIQIRFGLGRPLDPHASTLHQMLKAEYADVAIYQVAQTLYKLSIAIQSYRVFFTARGRTIMKALIAFITICGMFLILGTLFYCNPIARARDDRITRGYCLDRAALFYAFSGINILNDLSLIAIPVSFLLKLQVARHHKVLLCSIFSAGVLVTIVSIIRLKALYENVSDPVHANQTLNGVNIALWSHLELCLAIICGSIPALKAFVSRVILGHDFTLNGTPKNPTGISSQNRRQSRHQSYALNSMVRDNEGDVNPEDPVARDNKRDGKVEEPDAMAITIHRSIDMRSARVGDTESEEDLIIQDGDSLGSWHGNSNVTSVVTRGSVKLLSDS